MIDLGYKFLYSPGWYIFNAIALCWGLLAIVWLLFAAPRSHRDRWIVWSGIALLVLSALFSMVFEELLPLARRTSPANATRVGVGMTGFAVAVIMLIYRAFPSEVESCSR